ncbi:hypothetical protein, partial [Flavobacterium sp. YO12]|uniref:hypothetical protein n=1 Tax=Flavobacterium sp. YO12 TaxID=1920029 RepID=UPI001026B63C
LSDNNVFDISPLAHLSIKALDISNNPLENIHDLFENESHLEHLQVNDTGFSRNNNLILSVRENHLEIAKNRVFILNSEGKIIKGYYPVKILLLGNHGSGKSQFLNYFLSGKLKEKSETTDILQIEFFKENTSSILPNA